MALLEGNATDVNGIAVVGALVYIYDGSGNLASLEDDLGQPLANPVTTGEGGYWSAYIADGGGQRRLDYYWGGRLRLRETTAAKGEPGGNVMSIGTILDAAGITVDPGVDVVTVSGWLAIGDEQAGLTLVYDADVDAAYVSAHPGKAFVDLAGRGFREASPVRYMFDAYGVRTVESTVGGETVQAIAPQIWIDPVNGSDANSGSSYAQRIKTKAALLAHPLMGPAGTNVSHNIVRDVTIGIVGHPTQVFDLDLDFHDGSANNGYRYMDGGGFVGVGYPAVFDSADDVAGGAITAHATIAGAYETNWTHTMVAGNLSRFRVWNAQGKPLVRVSSEAGTAVAGTYWYTGDPVAGVAKRIVWKPFAGDPSAVKITRRDRAVALRGGLVQNIWAYRNGHNSGSIENGGGTRPVELRGLLAYDGTKHNLVAGAGKWIDVYAANCHDDMYDPLGETPALLTCSETNLLGKTLEMTRVSAIADSAMWGTPTLHVGQAKAQAFLAHDSIGIVRLAAIKADHCSSIGLAGGWDLTAVTSNIVTAMYIPSMSNPATAAMLACGSALSVISRCFLGSGQVGFRWASGTNLSVKSNLMIQAAAFSGGGVTSVNVTATIDAQNNICVDETLSGAPFFDLNADACAMTAYRNLFVKGEEPLSVAPYNAGYSYSLMADYNVFVGDGSGGVDNYTRVQNTQRTFANSQSALSIDANGAAAANAAAVGMTAGSFPTRANPDVRFIAAGLGDSKLTDPITQAEIEEMRARSASVAAVKARLLLDPNGALRPVVTA